jgi:hypothetical protein
LEPGPARCILIPSVKFGAGAQQLEPGPARCILIPSVKFGARART